MTKNIGCPALDALAARWLDSKASPLEIAEHTAGCPACTANRPVFERFSREYRESHPDPDPFYVDPNWTPAGAGAGRR